MGKFDELPHDTILEMLPYVADYRSLCRFGMCNVILDSITKDDELWIVMCQKFLPSQRYQDQYARTLSYSDANWKGWHRFFISVRMESKAQQIALFINQSAQGGSADSSFVNTARDTIGKMLDLRLSSGGCIGPSGAALLSKVLASNHYLQTLDLHGQLIRAEGMASLKSCLSSCKMLQSISLSQNKLGPAGAQIVADLIATSPTIVSFDVRANHFGPEGGKIVLKSLHGKTALRQLFLDDNAIGDADGALIIAAAFPKLDTLFMRDNGLGKASLAEIHRVLTAMAPPPRPPPPPAKPPKRTAKVLDVSNAPVSSGAKKEGGNMFPIKGIDDVVQLAKSRGVKFPLPPAGNASQSCHIS